MTRMNIIILGIEKAGKSSILRRYKSDQFESGEKPTLGTQISKIVVDNADFIFYDLGGQGILRKAWYDRGMMPKAIIFVVDCTLPVKKLVEVQKEFKNVLDFYYSREIGRNRSGIPLLILGNKIDLKEDLSPYFLNELFFSLPANITVQFGYTSAKTSEGIKENFNWLIGEMIKSGI